MVAQQTVKSENNERCLKPSQSTPDAHGFVQGAFLRRLKKTTKVDSDMQTGCPGNVFLCPSQRSRGGGGGGLGRIRAQEGGRSKELILAICLAQIIDKKQSFGIGKEKLQLAKASFREKLHHLSGAFGEMSPAVTNMGDLCGPPWVSIFHGIQGKPPCWRRALETIQT